MRREGFPAYQANIKTYLMAYVAFRSGSQLDLDTIWGEHAVSDELADLLRSWSHGVNKAIVETAGARNVTEWLTPEDLDHIALCKKVDGSTWFRIHEWGKRTGKLKDWETGIAHTLSAYAASGWERGPSPKQAMHGARIFRLSKTV